MLPKLVAVVAFALLPVLFKYFKKPFSCGIVPDGNTDVLIKARTPFKPTINVNTNVRSVMLSYGANVLVKAGVLLNVTGSKEEVPN